MTLHYVQLTLGTKTYKDKVSTQGCADVADFRGAIKNKFSPDLDSYGPHHLTLFQPDGTTEIDPETPVTNLKEIPWKPMVVNVLELPLPAPNGSSKKQLTYKGMSTEASCRKYFDALAKNLALYYQFKWGLDGKSKYPTFGDVLFAYDKNEWDYQYEFQSTKDNDDFTGVPQKVPKLNVPLPELFDERVSKEWTKLKEWNQKTNSRIHDARLPTDKGKAFIILPTAEYNDETVRFFKRIGAKGKLFTYEDDLIVKDEAELSGSGSETSSSPL
jgi:hypothetical protein